MCHRHHDGTQQWGSGEEAGKRWHHCKEALMHRDGSICNPSHTLPKDRHNHLKVNRLSMLLIVRW